MNVKRILLPLLAAALALLIVPAALAASGYYPEGYSSPGCPATDAIMRNDGYHNYVCTSYQEPTCTQAGQTQYTCIYCGDVQYKSSPATGHSWSEWDQMGAPDCVSPGYEAHWCMNCGVEEDRAIPALGHDWGSWYDMTPAGCLTSGARQRECRRCGFVESQTVPALGHAWGDWTVDERGTCVERGMLMRVCSRCGLKDWQYSDYGDHDWGPWQRVKEPGPDGPGLERRVCRYSSDHVQERDIYGSATDVSPWPVNPTVTPDTPVTYAPVPGGPTPVPVTENTPGLLLYAVCTDVEPFYFDGFGQLALSYALTVVNTGSGPLEIRYVDIATAAGARSDSVVPTILNPGESTLYQAANTFSETEKTSDNRLHISFYMTGYTQDNQAVASNQVALEHIALSEIPPWHPDPETKVSVAKFVVSTSLHEAGYMEGETVEYRIQVTNVSETLIPSLEVWDALYSTAGPLAVLTDLAPHETREVGYDHVVTAQDVANGCIINVAAAEWTDPESKTKQKEWSFPAVTVKTIAIIGDESDCSVDIFISFDQPPANGSFYVEGETFPITVTWQNTGKDPLYHVNVYDDMADWMKAGPFGSGKLAEDASLAPGETGSFTYTYVVDDIDVGYGYVADSASVYGYSASGNEYWNADYMSSPAGGENAYLILEKVEISSPGPDGYYQPGDEISYTLTYTNVGDITLTDVRLYDTLKSNISYSGFSITAHLAPQEHCTFNFKYTVTEDDAVNGWVVNSAVATFCTDTLKDVPVLSNVVYSPAGANIPPVTPEPGTTAGLIPPVTAVPGGGTPGNGVPGGGTPGGVLPGGGEESCMLTLTAFGDDSVLYTLEPCHEHSEAAKKMQGYLAKATFGMESAWDSVRTLWQKELDHMYQKLLDNSFGDARQAVMNDRLAFLAMLNAYEAMNGRSAETLEVIAGMLMRRCCDLCYVSQHAPEPRPDSLVTGTYQQAASAAAAQCGMIFEAEDTGFRYGLNLCGEHSGSQRGVKEQLDNAHDAEAYLTVFQRAARLWQTSVDAKVNPRYKAASAESRPLIAQWRKSVDAMISARAALLTALYPDNPETVAELTARDWQEIALMTCGK